MKPNKSPYEIRLDLLRLAYDILSVKSIDNAGNISYTNPNSAEIIAEATKLNRFVSNNGTE